MNVPLKFILPSKGRLHDEILATLEGVNIQLNRPHRQYVARLDDPTGVEVHFLPTHAIAHTLRSGAGHVGITGLDLLRENEIALRDCVGELLLLDIGKADVVLAVPDEWRDVRSLADIADIASTFTARYNRRLRIATKYPNLSHGFLRHHGVCEFRLTGSLGATEAAPSNGEADCIVDISSSGDTLRANGLRILRDGLLLRSAATVCFSVSANWSPAALAAAAGLLDRVAAGAPFTAAAPQTILCRISGLSPAGARKITHAGFRLRVGADQPPTSAKPMRSESDPSKTPPHSTTIHHVHCNRDTQHALTALLIDAGITSFSFSPLGLEEERSRGTLVTIRDALSSGTAPLLAVESYR